MKFLVEFKSNNSFAVAIEKKRVGVKLLDEIREWTIPELKTERVKEFTTGVTKDLQMEVSEKEARKTGLFEETNVITVAVPEKYFNQFCDIKVVTEKNPGTGEILSAGIEYTQNFYKIFKHWEELGFPLEITE